MNLFQKYASALSAVVLTASVAAVSAGAAAQAAAGPSAADGTHGRLPGRRNMGENAEELREGFLFQRILQTHEFRKKRERRGFEKCFLPLLNRIRLGK